VNDVVAYAVLNKIPLSSLTYGIVSVHKRVNYDTNEVLPSKHECVMDFFACNLLRLSG